MEGRVAREPFPVRDGPGFRCSHLHREVAPPGIGRKALIALPPFVPVLVGGPLGRAAVGPRGKGGGVAVKVGTGAREIGTDSLGAAARQELAAVLGTLVGAELAPDADAEGGAGADAGVAGHGGEAAGIGLLGVVAARRIAAVGGVGAEDAKVHRARALGRDPPPGAGLDGHAEGLRVFVNTAEHTVELGLRRTRHGHAGTLALPEKTRSVVIFRPAPDLQALSRITSGNGGMVAHHDRGIHGHVPPGGTAGDRTAVTG